MYRKSYDVLSFAHPGHEWSSALQSKEPLPIDIWTHVALVRQGQEMRLYINGKLANSTQTHGVVDHANEHVFRVGSRYPGGGSYADSPLDGEVDGALWFFSPFSDEQIARLYSSNFARTSKRETRVRFSLPNYH